MRAYLAASISGGRGQQDAVAAIAAAIQEHADVPSLHVAAKELTAEGEVGSDPHGVWARDIEWIGSCDVLVAEVTTPSLGVGYEIGVAEQLDMPVLALFDARSDRTLSRMVSGNPKVTVAEYASEEEAVAAVHAFFDRIK